MRRKEFWDMEYPASQDNLREKTSRCRNSKAQWQIFQEKATNLSFSKKPFSVKFEERPVPKLQSEHDVLIAINYTGICGSDVHYWVEGAIGPYVVKDPMVLGHESAGTIVSVGSAVKTLKVGDRIALEPGYPCRRCPACLSGHYNLCPEMHFAATPPIDGTLAGFYTSPADFCYKLPENVSLQEGALIEPLAVAVHICKQAVITPGQSSLVHTEHLPLSLLIFSLPVSNFAKSFAATHVFTPQRVSAAENASNLKAEVGLPEGADVVIDASGAEPSIQAAINVTRRGGTYVQGGMGKADINFPIMELCTKEITAKGSFRYGSGDYSLAVELVRTGKVDVKKLITGEVQFEDAEQAFKSVKEGKGIKDEGAMAGEVRASDLVYQK
ncbi:hypothetical protein EYC84_004863 [Monilinia fructicola]|uniref:D-xylulose reductase n=1 Tax=Monilinia fructicola TaxID=38448 RepID=A0A5M9K5L1_MONFR|nr:hypothetical protein EYC84_004863 [Monilinia fructicola]